MLPERDLSGMFDLREMKRICTAPISYFGSLEGFQTVDTEDGRYFFLDRGAKHLGVAHLDTVAKAAHFNYDISNGRNRVYTPTLDDRLGVTILLQVLEEYIPGEYDILLTEGEESGRSTGKHFVAPEGRQYNWVFEFDRGGTDAVHYQFQSPEWLEALRDPEKGMLCSIDHGMFSDIAFMGGLGCCAVNVGVAYHDYHSSKAYADLSDTALMVARFLNFWQNFKDQHFAHTAEERFGSGWGSSYYDYDGWGGYATRRSSAYGSWGSRSRYWYDDKEGAYVKSGTQGKDELIRVTDRRSARDSEEDYYHRLYSKYVARDYSNTDRFSDKPDEETLECDLPQSGGWFTERDYRKYVIDDSDEGRSLAREIYESLLSPYYSVTPDDGYSDECDWCGAVADALVYCEPLRDQICLDCTQIAVDYYRKVRRAEVEEFFRRKWEEEEEKKEEPFPSTQLQLLPAPDDTAQAQQAQEVIVS